MTEITKSRDDQRMDEIIGNLLRIGVSLAAALVSTGGLIFLIRHPMPAIDYRKFQGEPPDFTTIRGIFHSAITWHGRGIIQLGLLVLIATPIARVIFSVVAFIYEKDWTYVAVTLIVLALLTYSLLGGHL